MAAAEDGKGRGYGERREQAGAVLRLSFLFRCYGADY